MASLRIENLPERVMMELQREAAAGARDVSDVAADRLARSFGDFVPHQPRDAQELLQLADAVRVGAREAWLTPEFIRAAREDGRA